MGESPPPHTSSKSPPLSPLEVSLSPNNHSAGILVNVETAHLHGQRLLDSL